MTRETFEAILTAIKNNVNPTYNRKIHIVTNTVLGCGGYSTSQQTFDVGCESIEMESGYIKFHVQEAITGLLQYDADVYLPYENIAFVFDGARR